MFYFDFETTGLNPFHSKIIEYCFMKHDGTFIESLINPGFNISDKIESVTHISNNELINKPSIEQKKGDRNIS